jgi:hypothetical protein
MRDRKAEQGDDRVPGLYLPISVHLPAPAVYYLLTALLIVLSIASRLGNLNAFSLSNDEGAYLMWAWLVHSGYPLYTETASVSAPLFIALLDWTFDVGGISLVSGRALVLAFFGLALISLVGAGALLRHWLAGLAAALAFSLAPLAFGLSRMAMGEIPSLALATLSLALALAYWRRGGWGWLALSGLAWSLSLLVKSLNPLVALPILWLVMSRQNEVHPSIWRLGALAVWGAAALLPILFCLLAYDPAALYEQAVAFRFHLRTAIPWRMSQHLLQFDPFWRQQWGTVVLGLAGLVLLVLRARWEIMIPLGLWLAAEVVSVGLHSPLFLHHLVILLPPLSLLAGVAAVETAACLAQRRWAWSALGLAGGLAFLLALPGALQLNRTLQEASFGREAEAVAFLQQVTAPGDRVISDNLLLPFVAGRQTPPPLGDVAQVAIDSGRQTSQRLIAISEAYPVEAVANWALRLPYLAEYMEWVERHYLVRRAWDDYHVIYFGRRVAAGEISNRLEAQVGESIQLLGYEVMCVPAKASTSAEASTPECPSLEARLYWQAGAPVRENYTVFVQLLDDSGRLVAQHDGQPLYGYLPTSDWPPGEVIPDRHALRLPQAFAPGRYQLIAGMYRLATLERLPVRGAGGQAAGDRVVLTELEIRD